MRIVLCYPNEPEHLAQIQGAAPGHEVIDAGQQRIAVELLMADVFCGHAKVPVPWPEVVRHGSRQGRERSRLASGSSRNSSFSGSQRSGRPSLKAT